MHNAIDRVLQKLAVLVQEGRFEEQETDTLEIKPVPADAGSWKQIYVSANAFLNTRGGIIVLGIKEESKNDKPRRYLFTGYRAEAEDKLKELRLQFTDRLGQKLELEPDAFRIQIKEFLHGRVALVFIDGLSADRKYVFYRGTAYHRIVTGDHPIAPSEIDAQEEYREELALASELQSWPGTSMEALDLDALNDYILHLNRQAGQKVEAMKANIADAMPFLERKGFIKEGKVTLLGMLVCGQYPADFLGFRCQVHAYVQTSSDIAQDKQILAYNILPLMEASLAYILRNIQVGISAERGGTSVPQYPEEVLRETVNNALAHRDYSINKQVFISIKPGRHIEIRNPGRFRPHLLLEQADHGIPLRRIIPDAKARNPKLAHVLNVYSKWEGYGIGMATLVNLCLENRIDLPVYRLRWEEVCLFLKTGKLLDERMELYFQAFDSYLEKKAGGGVTAEQRQVLTYLMKSEWENQNYLYTILLTPDNNHFEALRVLECCGLIVKHPQSTASYPVFVVDRTLMRQDYKEELREIYGEALRLEGIPWKILNILYRHSRFSRTHAVIAKTAAFSIWHETRTSVHDIREFETFYRKIRHEFKRLHDARLIVKAAAGRGYSLNENYKSEHLF